MGGQSVFTGAAYQAAAAASVMARMVAETSLNWLEPLNDRPQVLSAETGGTGDDLRVVLGAEQPVLEVQAKRSLSGKKALVETLTEISRRSSRTGGPGEEVILLVGRGSSPEISDTFASDLTRLRQGRSDVRPITSYVFDSLENAQTLLRKLRVVPLDLETMASSGNQAAIANLRLVLDDQEEAARAWDTLLAKGVEICKGGQVNREEVEGLLRARNFTLRPVGPDARWELRLDHARDLFQRDRPKTAKGVVEALEQDLRAKSVGPRVRARLYNSMGAGLNQNDPKGAVEWFERALEFLAVPTATQFKGETELPLAVGVNWVDTTINLAAGLFASGKPVDAAVTLEPVLSLRPARAKAWGLAVRIAFVREQSPPLPPAEVADSPELREARAAAALERGDWQEAADLATRLISEGHQPVHLVALRASALVNSVIRADDANDRRSRLLAAERAATSAIERLEDTELDGHLVDTLIARAAVLELLDKPAEARADYARVQAIAPSNPNLLRKKVQELQERGDTTAALALLSDELSASNVVLLLLRAHVRLDAEDRAELVEQDLRSALELVELSNGRMKNEHRIHIAEVATRIEAVDLAEEALRNVPNGEMDWIMAVIKGRIAFMQENHHDGVAAYREAEKKAPNGEERERALIEFAAALSESGEHADAVAVYAEMDAGRPSHRGFRSYVNTLMRLEKFETVMSLLDRLEVQNVNSGVESLPVWALRVAVDIAWRQENFPSVIRYVLPLARNPLETESRLILASAYINTRQAESALPILRELSSQEDLPPRERMQTANLLKETGADAEALAQAFTALRQEPDDKQLIMNFVGIVATEAAEEPLEVKPDPAGGEAEPVSVDEGLPTVVADSWVRLVTDRASPVEYLIYSSPPVNAGRNEYLASDPAIQDILGKKRGEVVIRNAGRWTERHYRIEEILPAVVYVFRKLINEFEGRFPDTPFIQQYEVGETPTPESLAPILATLRASKDYTERIWAEYRAKRLPIAVVAVALRQPLGQTLGDLIGRPDQYVYADSPDAEEFAADVATAESSSRLVMTRQAFATLINMDAFDRVFSNYEVLVPSSLVEELEAELKQWNALVDKGRLGLFERDGGFGLSEIKPGEAGPLAIQFQKAVDELKSGGKVILRPLSALTEKDRKWRENLLGSSSFDAIAISRAEGAALYADDWGLKGIARNEYGVSSFSTAALTAALFAQRKISEEEYEDNTISLVRLGHYFVSIRSATIAAAFRKDHRIAQRVIARLGDPSLQLSSAVNVAVDALRLLGLTPIVAVSLQEATVALLRALLEGKSAYEIIPLFLSLAKTKFNLMPKQLAIIHSATMEVVRALGSVPRIRPRND